MTEFALSASFLALMLLGLWTIGGYQEVQRRAIIAARQGAFELSWQGAGTGTEATRLRLAGMHFDDAALTSATGRSRLADRDSMRMNAQFAPTPGEGTVAMNALLTPLRGAGGFLGGGFDLRNDGFLSGFMLVDTRPVSELPPPFRTLELQFRQPFALLSDGWSASGPHHVERRAGGLAPSHVLTSATSLWRGLSVPLGVLEPSLRQLCPGLIEPDRVPEDRLGPGPTSGAPVCP